MIRDRYGLSGDPFAGSAGESAFVAVPSRKKALAAIVACLTEGKGIAVLTAAPGLGKTSLCRAIARSLSEDYTVCHLHDASFTTRRSLLQSILHQLGQAYSGLTEHEARLQLLDAVQSLHPKQGLVLIVDEAHRLSDRILEELRSLSNHETEGLPLIRLLLCGNLTLEERLMDPTLSDIAERMLCHEILEPLTQEESAQLLDARIMQAGGDGWEHVFTRPATELICLASDGSPRQLEQLASRSLKIGAESREDKVSVEAVTRALQQLKELPLQWNEPANLESYAAREQHDTERDEVEFHETGEILSEMWETETMSEPSANPSTTEMSHVPPSEEATSPVPTRQPEETAVIEFGSGIVPIEPSPVASSHVPSSGIPFSEQTSISWSEIEVEDAYARLDQLFQSGTPVENSVPTRLMTMAPETLVEEGLLEEIRSLSAEVRSSSHRPIFDLTSNDSEDSVTRTESASTLADSPWASEWSDMPEWDVVQPEWVTEAHPLSEPIAASEPERKPEFESESSRPHPVESKLPESAASRKPAPMPEPTSIEFVPSRQNEPYSATLDFTLAPKVEAAPVEPTLVAESVASDESHTVESDAVDSHTAEGVDIWKIPEPSSPVRVDPPETRPYARLFSRLRNRRAAAVKK